MYKCSGGISLKFLNSYFMIMIPLFGANSWRLGCVDAKIDRQVSFSVFHTYSLQTINFKYFYVGFQCKAQ